MLHEQASPFSQPVQQRSETRSETRAGARREQSQTSRVRLFLSGALLLCVASACAALFYEAIAGLEAIQDQRAGQVTRFYCCWMASLLVFSVIRVQLDARKASEGHTLSVSRTKSSRRFLGVCVGVLVATVSSGVALTALASFPSLVVTPPAAWFIMTAASVLGAIAGARAFASR